MEREIALEVKDLHISYKCLKSFSIKKSLLHLKKADAKVYEAVRGVSFAVPKGEIIKKSLLHLKKADAKVYEAVRGVSFAVPKGEILGIVGKNGSGKSTMLRAIAGIFSPDSGTIDLKGNSVSLLSIGVGFQPKLTGRENIVLSGMLLGFSEEQVSEEQVRAKMDEIIEFANLGDFIDMPVKTYSSGMHSKLAFSITAILEADIMLIDEVLSVGDAKFKKKSYNKMKELISNEDRTVLIVSPSWRFPLLLFLRRILC